MKIKEKYLGLIKFIFIIFDENMNILDDDSIKKMEIVPCNDESSFLSITIYYYSYYRIAKKCGNEDFSSNAISEVSISKPFSIEPIFITENLIVTNKSLIDTISSSNNLNGYLTDRISLTTISETILSTNIIDTSILSEEKTSRESNSDPTISYDDISTNFHSIIQSSLKNSDIISTDKKSSIALEKISTNLNTNDILPDEIYTNTKLKEIGSNIESEMISITLKTNDTSPDEISTNTKLTILLSEEISTKIKSSALLPDKIITDIKSSSISDESFSFFNL